MGGAGVVAVVARDNPLREAVAAVGEGVGCHYRLRAEQGLTVETLDSLGLIKPIRQRIPTCDDHPCPLRDGCRFARVFAEGAGGRTGGRSGKKFRLAPTGRALLDDETVLRQLGAAVAASPLPRRILAALAEAGGTLTVFALNTALLEASLGALLAHGDAGQAGFTRGDLAAGLTLLDALGLLASDGRRVTLAEDAGPAVAAPPP